MERYPFKEIKSLHNEIVRKKDVLNVKELKIPNYTQVQILKYLIVHEGEEVYQKDFENFLNIRKSTISGILDTMEKNKIIKRASSKTDGRGKIIILSKAAKNLHEEIIEKFDAIERELIEGIAQSDLDVFFKVIDQMRQNLSKKGN